MANPIKTRHYHVETQDGKKTLCGVSLTKAPCRLYYKFRNELIRKNVPHFDGCPECVKKVKAIKAQKKLGI